MVEPRRHEGHEEDRRTFLGGVAGLLLSSVAVRAMAAERAAKPLPGLVRCANLTYARGKSSVCFASHFLAETRKLTNIQTDDAFTPVNLESQELFSHPFAVMTGEGGFNLTPDQRDNLRRYLTGGGFLLASSGCSSPPWDSSFRREIAQIFPEGQLQKLDTSHPVFHTVHEITELKTKETNVKGELEALIIEGRIVLVYSAQGLNDTKNAGGNCCCCGGNEITNARQMNVNLLAYALTH